MLPQLSDAELRLVRAAGLGAVGIRRLRRLFATAEEALAAGPDAWEEAGIPARLWPVLRAVGQLDVSAARQELASSGAWALSVFHADYPAMLLEIYDPPPVLYGIGKLATLHAPCVAVVGSRRATRYGHEHGFRIARRLAERGFTVISGLAVGVDATAHRAAMEAGGSTVAVLGSGVRHIYPTPHVALAERLCNHGALVSECPPGVTPERVHFPRRNRIISGLSSAVVVVEAREDSGSLITARQALEQGREVFVVPGPAGGANRGGHRLLSEGAGWAEDGDEIAAALLPAMGESAVAAPRVETRDIPLPWRPVWEAIGDESRHVDAIIEKSGLRSSDVLGILLQLELHGWVQQQKGKLFVRQV